MEISRDDLSSFYVSLSDAELRAIDRSELTDLAQQCYDLEFKRRRLAEESPSPYAEPQTGSREEIPDWLDTAVAVCSFEVGSGQRYAEEAERACDILRDAGIPTQVVSEHEDGMGPDSLNVMVPGVLSLKATSVLDRNLFNEELEETWRSHFDELSDKELHALNADDLCAGLLDRAARLKRVYENALVRRKTEIGPRER
jgi:hypothetical protein